jgi:hypothetical protein
MKPYGEEHGTRYTREWKRLRRLALLGDVPYNTSRTERKRIRRSIKRRARQEGKRESLDSE